MSSEALEVVSVVMQWVAVGGGLVGAGAIVSHRVNRNFDRRFENEKTERDEARKAADEREEARMQDMINLQEGFVAIGHVAQKTAEAHLLKCGPNEGISEALHTYAECRAKSDAALRKNAAKFSHREARGAS